MISLQVGKRYVTKHGFIYTVISTNRKNQDGYNVVAEYHPTDNRGKQPEPVSVFQLFTQDGKNAHEEYSLIAEYKPRLKVQFTIDLPEELYTYNIDEINSLVLCRLKGLRPETLGLGVGPSFEDSHFKNVNTICSFED